MIVTMYGYTTNEDGEQVSKPTRDEKSAQRAIFYFDSNDTTADDTTSKQSFMDAGAKKGFVGDCQLTDNENGWKIEKSTAVEL